MLRLVFKAIHLLWPFLKRAIFGDRTIREVLLEHKHVTYMFAILLFMTLSLSITLKELVAARATNRDLEEQIELPTPNITPVGNVTRNRRKLFDEAL